MANDIIGGPELLVVKGMLFWLFPCTALELSCIEAWVRWATNNSGKQTEIETHNKLQTPAGAAQLLFWSTRRGINKPYKFYIDFIDNDDDAAIEVYNFWFNLNQLPEFKGTKNNSASTSNSTESADEAIIRALVDKFGLSIQDILGMTPVQQLKLLEVPSQSTIMTDEEYLVWAAHNVK